MNDVLRVVADSIEESGRCTPPTLLAEVWYAMREESTALAAVKEDVDSLDVRCSDEPAPRR